MLSAKPIILGAFVLLAGCAHPPDLGPGEVTFGNAVHHNMAAQIANPDAAPGRGVDGLDGKRGQLGMHRYHTDDPKAPARIDTRKGD